ncbi:phage major capsid protein [Wenxinia marina]|uniref:Phage major capsid protein, HK97 family n=1 Tax=Wenxinia marina DSM 24838 TaxID=1123501 RepID=A0A0D0NRD4_9RHOB|nr:phage major capsid protein [Wenxinia marina]KIQ70760.1 phage major capsid protein, HK97 family [Wenxinia marina DSM 24838]GGL80354.1 major capsid protein [Wenxinia marina]
MLDSVKISRRQSEIRQTLSGLVAKEAPSEDETRQMDELDREYRSNETRFRAALVAEDTERREAGAELETRADREWAQMVAGFELRQVALHLDEGRAMTGRTAEIVTELRESGGYRGVPVPWEALEQRAGETVSTGTPDPIETRPIIDRLFPDSVAARMGAQMVSIDHGEVEWPVVTQGATVAWQSSETGSTGAAQAFQTTDRALAPDHTLGCQMKITRKALKQSGAALEAAVRRDMNSAISVEMDRVVFLGSGASGEPLGVIAGAATYGISSTAIGAAGTWAAFRAAVVRFMTASASNGPGGVRALIRPEMWDAFDGAYVTGTAITEWDRLLKSIPAGNIAMSHNALADPAGDPLAVSSLLTTSAGGVPPIFVGKWGAVDLIRDPYTDAQSGGLRITALATMDVTVARPAQLELLTGIQIEAAE